MKCRFCDHELTPDMLRSKGCGACGRGCGKIHCPYCGEENVIVPGFLDKLSRTGHKPSEVQDKS